MKKFFLTLFIAAASLGVKAQDGEFKPFRVGFDFGYAIPSGDGAKGGVIFALEPKYALSDKLALGLRMEGALTVRASVDSEGFLDEAEAKLSSSYLLTSDYYFNTNSFRPFFGLGAGVHMLASASSNGEEMTFNAETGEIENDGVTTDTKFGVTPRIGFDYGHFRMAVDYNYIPKTEEIKNSYIGIKLGFFLGGGRR